MSNPVTVLKDQCRLLAFLFFLCCHGLASAQLSAAFNALPSRSGCSPLVVNFFDASTGNPTQWRWDLGNGVTSLLRNPSTTYFNPGTYAVKLVVRNAAGSAAPLQRCQHRSHPRRNNRRRGRTHAHPAHLGVNRAEQNPRRRNTRRQPQDTAQQTQGIQSALARRSGSEPGLIGGIPAQAQNLPGAAIS